ncbi:hypothetical protein BD779DRAFT_1509014 [Infundibulicybe gibba]|nr:hypothetical protein BD779DRAFT_1509014 [Infundibulicybe gibba]
MQRARGHESILLRILTLTPHLYSLRLSGYTLDSPPFTAALIRALHPSRPPKATLCQHLRSLMLSGLRSCPDGLCTAMLRARWGDQARANGVACMEGGYVNLEGGSHKRDQKNMKKLCEEGMEMTLHLRGSNGWT